MIKKKYLLENEKEPRFIDEKKYQERMLLDRCLRSYIHNENSKRPVLIKEQQTVLREYFDYLLAKRDNSPVSTYNRILQLYHMSFKINLPYNEITKKELMEYFANLGQISQNTVILKQTFAKQFFTWLGKEGVIDWIKFAKRKKRNLTPERLLTSGEIKTMVNSCLNDRDKAMLMVTYEGALRSGELASIRIKDISEDEFGIRIRVDGKTGIRTILLVDAMPYIKQWLNQHQYKDSYDSPLFYSFSNSDYGRALKHPAIFSLVKKTAKIGRIKKRVFPHLLRHSRLDYLGKKGFTERDLKIFAGWTENSDMASTYLHYGMEVVEEKLLRLKGKRVNVVEEENNDLEVKICGDCGKKNPQTNQYCDCGSLLLTGRKEKAEEVLNKLFEDEEFKKLIKKILKK